MNHVHKDTKDLVSVIIFMGNNILGGDTVFCGGVKTSDLVNRAPFLEHLHGRIVLGPFGFFRGGSLWRGPRALISRVQGSLR